MPRRKSKPSRTSCRNTASSVYQRRAVHGRGAYKYHKVPVKGKSFAPDYGARLGSTIGEGIQSLASVFGLGEYHIKKNSLMKTINMGTTPPRVMNTSRGEATVFHHREYVGELYAGAIAAGDTTTQFNIQQYTINPGNPLLFPWLATAAANFQEWEARGIIVELKTETSDVVATGGFIGSMMAGVDYNTISPAPYSKVQLENLEYASSVKPSFSMIIPIECKAKNDVLTHLYVAVDSNYNGGDARLYNLGNLYIATQGLPIASTNVAEIWISYEIAFYKPVINNIIEATSAWLVQTQLSLVTTTNPFGTPGTQDNNFPVPDTMVQYGFQLNAEGIISFPSVPGTWQVYYYIIGADAVASPAFGSTVFNQCTLVPTGFPSSAGIQKTSSAKAPLTVVASQFLSQCWDVSISADDVAPNIPPGMQIVLTTIPTAPCYGFLSLAFTPSGII